MTLVSAAPRCGGPTWSIRWRGELGVGVGGGEFLQGLHSDQNRGLGDDGRGASITGVRVVVRDQSGSTLGTYGLAVRSGTDAAGPTTGAGGVIASFGPIALPASTLLTPIAWLITST
ncbi:MAG: hypothetical protein HZB39_17345 [Planctomycetes bacterium]|nr:hypothetical protein [Planctomycetota bacterium]